MVTWVPTAPLVGVKPVMEGIEAMRKLVELVVVPAGLVTVMGPLVAPVGTMALSWVAEIKLKLAATPLNLTAEVPVKLSPRIVTVAPTPPEVGLKLVMRGRLMRVKFSVLVEAAKPLKTRTTPVTAVGGT
nr:hypothetical protein [Candidatus Cyanaurora vandensis]